MATRDEVEQALLDAMHSTAKRASTQGPGGLLDSLANSSRQLAEAYAIIKSHTPSPGPVGVGVY